MRGESVKRTGRGEQERFACPRFFRYSQPGFPEGFSCFLCQYCLKRNRCRLVDGESSQTASRHCHSRRLGVILSERQASGSIEARAQGSNRRQKEPADTLVGAVNNAFHIMQPHLSSACPYTKVKEALCTAASEAFAERHEQASTDLEAASVDDGCRTVTLAALPV